MHKKGLWKASKRINNIFFPSGHQFVFTCPPTSYHLPSKDILLERKKERNVVNHAFQSPDPQYFSPGSRSQHSQCRILLLELWRMLFPTQKELFTFLSLSSFSFHLPQLIPFPPVQGRQYILTQTSHSHRTKIPTAAENAPAGASTSIVPGHTYVH